MELALLVPRKRLPSNIMPKNFKNLWKIILMSINLKKIFCHYIKCHYQNAYKKTEWVFQKKISFNFNSITKLGTIDFNRIERRINTLLYEYYVYIEKIRQIHNLTKWVQIIHKLIKMIWRHGKVKKL